MTVLSVSSKSGFLATVLAVTSFLAAEAAGAEVQGAAQAAPAERFVEDLRFRAIAPAAAFQQMRQRAGIAGTVRVIVGLRASFTPEGVLSEGQRAAQRNGIGRATASVLQALEGTDHRVVHTYETVPYIALELSAAALSRLQASSLASTIDPDRLARPSLAQTSVIVEATESASLGRDGGGQVIAVLDTGIQKTHPFLKTAQGTNKVVSEACYSGNGDCPGGATESTVAGSGAPCTYAPAACAHGTRIAGIAAGRGVSRSGVAREAQLISIRVYSQFTGPTNCGSGEDPCALSFVSDQLKGLERVLQLRDTYSIGAVSLALGGGQFSNTCDDNPLKPVIDSLRSARIATVVPSGNEGFTNAVNAPGCISTAVTVGATDNNDTVTLFSNSGAPVDFFAPGDDVNSSVPGSAFAPSDGTSMASAHVAGAFAVMREVDPLATVTEMQAALEASGKPVTDVAAEPDLTRDRIRVLSAGANLRHTGFAFPVNVGPVAGAELVSDGVGLARRTNANDNPVSPPIAANFTLSGIPGNAQIRRAFIVYQVIGAPDPTFIFRGSSRTAKLVGASGQFNCWATNNGGAYRTYRYEIPAGGVTGNGVYAISGIGGTNSAIAGRPDGQGASLIVAYSVPGAPRQGRIYLRFGSMTARPAGAAMSHLFSGLTVPNGTVTRALHVGVGDGESFNDPPMRFAATNITPSNFWSGTEGNFWDDNRLTIAAGLLPVGATARTNTQAATGECLTWAYAGLVVN